MWNNAWYIECAQIFERREGGREGESQPLNHPMMFKLLSFCHRGENLDHLSKVTQLVSGRQGLTQIV